MSKKNKKNKANEPEVGYSGPRQSKVAFKKVTIATLDEQEDGMRKYSANLTPPERMEYLYELIELAYGHILQQIPRRKMWDKKIHIRKKCT